MMELRQRLPSLELQGFSISDSSRIKRLHSIALENLRSFERLLVSHKTTYHAFTSGYDPHGQLKCRTRSWPDQILNCQNSYKFIS